LVNSRLEEIVGLGGFTMKVLEMLKNPWIKGVRSDGSSEASNTIY
jgi:hypothetical protein